MKRLLKEIHRDPHVRCCCHLHLSLFKMQNSDSRVLIDFNLWCFRQDKEPRVVVVCLFLHIPCVSGLPGAMRRELRSCPTVDPDSVDAWRAKAQSRTLSADSVQSGRWLAQAAAENFETCRDMCSGKVPKLPRCLTWASCCSGCEGPLFCMQAINDAAKVLPGLAPWCLSHVFSCEKDGEKRKWIANASVLAAETLRSLTETTAQQESNVTECKGCCRSGIAGKGVATPCLFVDICELGQDMADCAAHGQKCPVPQVDLLVLGTSCKDMSRANPFQQKDAAVLSQQASRGGSAQTFHGMLSYLQNKCPPLVLFENVDSMDDSKGTELNNMDIFLAETSARGYESQVCMTDAAEFGCCARRRRVYVLLVRTAVNPLLDFTSRPLTAVFATFRALLLGCLRGGPCVTQILFDHTSEPVQAELGLRLDKRAKQKEKEAEKKQATAAPPQTWVEQHMQFAQDQRLRWGQAVAVKLAMNQWYQTLGDREKDALSLLQQCAPRIVFRDLSQSIMRVNSNTWKQDASKHVMSTVLPKMALWCEAQGRLVLGREALLMQGFPVKPFLEILAAHMEAMPLAQQWHPSEALMMDLAGNAMALPVVLAMVQCALAALNWKGPTPSGQAAPLALSQSEDLCWHGSSWCDLRVFHVSSVLPVLYCLLPFSSFWYVAAPKFSKPYFPVVWLLGSWGACWC